MGKRMEVSGRIDFASNRNGSDRGLNIRSKEEIGTEVRQRQEIIKKIEKAMKIGK